MLITQVVALTIAVLFSSSILMYERFSELKKEAEIAAATVEETYTHLQTQMEAITNAITSLPNITDITAIRSLLRFFYLQGIDINQSQKTCISGMWWYTPEKARYVSQYGIIEENILAHTLPKKATLTKHIIFTSEYVVDGALREGTLSKGVWDPKGNYLGSLHVKIDLHLLLRHLEELGGETFYLRIIENNHSISLFKQMQTRFYALHKIPYTIEAEYRNSLARYLIEHQYVLFVLSLYICILCGLWFIKRQHHHLMQAYVNENFEKTMQMQSMINEKQILTDNFYQKNNILSIQVQACKKREALWAKHLKLHVEQAADLGIAIDAYIAAINLYAKEIPHIHVQQKNMMQLIKKQILSLIEPTLRHANTHIDSRVICQEILETYADEIALREIDVTTNFPEKLPFLLIVHEDYQKLILGLVQRALADVTKGGAINLMLDVSKQKKMPGVMLKITTKGLGLNDTMLYKALDSRQNENAPFCNFITPNMKTIKEAIKEIGGHVECTHYVSQGSVFTLWVPIHSAISKRSTSSTTQEVDNVVRLFT